MQISPNDSSESVEMPESKNKIVSNSEDAVTSIKSHSLRRLLVFQLKLAVDALRDILLSPVSIICTILDFFEKKHGPDSYFEKLMAFGRNTERKINLFEQHEKNVSSIDSVVDRVEDVIVDEYQNKNISKRTMAAIQQALKKEKGQKK
jgi:hypothetical protein